MHAQLVRAKLLPGKAGEAAPVFRDSILPAAREQKGFVSAHVLVDREGGRFAAISLWETAADLEAIIASGFFQEQVGKLAAAFDGPPEREVYEVVVQS